MNYYITIDGAIVVICVLLGAAALLVLVEIFIKDKDNEK